MKNSDTEPFLSGTAEDLFRPGSHGYAANKSGTIPDKDKKSISSIKGMAESLNSSLFIGVKMIRLRYGNTNTFYIPGTDGGLLIDTDYAGTLPAFYKAMKNSCITVKDISFVLATHYHPDHMGLIGELMKQGVKLLLADVQKDSVHFSDHIFDRDKLPYDPIDETAAVVVSCEESRDFLEHMGISGEIIHTPSHSGDSISLILDNGDCFVGDLEPFEYLGAYDENPKLESDWERILSFHPKRFFYAHAPEMIVEE